MREAIDDPRDLLCLQPWLKRSKLLRPVFSPTFRTMWGSVLSVDISVIFFFAKKWKETETDVLQQLIKFVNSP